MTELLDDLADLADRQAAVAGVVGVVLGGSRARGTHRPDSDYDLGLYYQGALDVAALQRLADEVGDEPAELTAPGGWGPWVDGGGWLTIAGQRVDWIYRDLERVRRIWRQCQAGTYEIGFQVGHPLGFYGHAYAGELALARVLADPAGVLGALQAETRHYPEPLGEALVRGLWEADFALRLAGYGAAGDDPTYAAGCLFRAMGVAGQALHGRARRWVVNEKGLITAAGELEIAPSDFADRAHGMLAVVGVSSVDIAVTVRRAAALIADVRAALG